MESKPIEVTTQMLIDVGLNAFGLELFAESIAGKKDVKTFDPISFRYKGVRVTISPDPESHPQFKQGGNDSGQETTPSTDGRPPVPREG